MKKWMTLCGCMLLLLMTACASAPPTTVTEQPPAPQGSSADRIVKAVWIPFMEVNEMLSSGSVEEAKTAITAPALTFLTLQPGTAWQTMALS